MEAVTPSSERDEPVIQTSHYCATCQRQTLHVKPRINNVLHLVLSVLTVGIWLVVWAALGLGNSAERARCSVCGSKPGLAAVSHEVKSAFAGSPVLRTRGSAPSPGGDEVAPSTWLPPGARPPR